QSPQVGLEGSHGLFEKSAEGRRVDLAQAVGLDRDFLPRPLAVGNVNALVVAVNLQPLQLVQRANAEALDQLGLLEGLAADAVHQPHRALQGGVSVEEPAVTLVRRRNLDDAAVVPVGVAKRAEFMDAFVDPVEDVTLPLARLALVADALDGVPATAVDLPRH